MNEKERKGCYELLKILKDTELLSLTETVTKKQIIVKTNKDALKAIVAYSKSSLELLKRKKIKRDILFQYLVNKSIAVPVNADKSTLVQKILSLWEVTDRPTFVKIEDEDSSDGGGNSFTSPTSSGMECATTDQQVQTPPDNFGSSTSRNLSDSQLNHQAAQGQTVGSSSGNFSFTVKQEVTLSSSNNDSNYQQHSINIKLGVTTAGSGHVSGLPHPEQGQGEHSSNQNKQNLGETFARWFFKILNSHNPENSETPEDFGPHHFWDDAKLMVECYTANSSSDMYSGSVLTSERLLALVKEEHLIFNPNISSEGVFVMTSPHGMLIVLVCGTIHRTNSCLGTFEQMFGLVADPRLNDNWKIKIVKLKLQSEQVTKIPKLTDRSEYEIKALAAV